MIYYLLDSINYEIKKTNFNKKQIFKNEEFINLLYLIS